MMKILYFLLILNLTVVFGAKNLKNKLFGEPRAVCGIHEITVMMETELPFSGNVYAKGFFDREACRVKGDGIGNTVNITIPITSDCGMRKKRMVSPRGVSMETTVIIMFHRLFLTKADKAFHILCQYQEMNTIYTQKLDVSQLPTTDIPTANNDEQAVLPKCKYEVLEGGENGPPLTYGAIGQPVYHKWTCSPQGSKRNVHCLTVHSCVVDDGQGLKQYLLDEKGCPVDPLLLDEIDYKGDLEAGRDSYVFKFADKPTIFFSCQLRVEVKDPESGMCK
uniref:ZP domain-containing protein n=1 Tax=Panagrolaimus sp. JU765 TaxID=591449 RepID=A0AC34Q6Y8_9BILA